MSMPEPSPTTVVAPGDTRGRAPGVQEEGAQTQVSDKTGIQKAKDFWDRLADKVRELTPAVIINNGSRINFGLKAVADSMGIASGLRKETKSYPRLFANIVTTSTLIPGLLYKEQPVSEKEIESYQKMSPLEYVWTKFKQAFDPKHHIVETVALATVFNGVFTAFSGIKQSAFKGFSPISFTSWKNISMEVWTGMFTTVAGLILGLVPQRERAWQLSTAVFTWRIPFKGTQAYTALFKGYPNANPPVPAGDPYQMINFLLQQTANIFGFFYTGVKKTEDGQIIRLGKDELTIDINKQKIRGYNYKPTRSLFSTYSANDAPSPTTTITSPSSLAKAMPTREGASRITTESAAGKELMPEQRSSLSF